MDGLRRGGSESERTGEGRAWKGGQARSWERMGVVWQGWLWLGKIGCMICF